MGFADHYLERFSDPEPLISNPPRKNLKSIVVIPAYNESGLLNSLDSLYMCRIPANVQVEVITVVNWPEGAADEVVERNKKIFSHAVEWSKGKNEGAFQFHFLLLPDVPEKYAGVGYARKYGMDEAVRRFNLTGTNGLILSFDADALADPDLFISLDEHFTAHPEASGCNIYFEHPAEGDDFPPGVYEAIVFYELHLRYYYQALRFTGHPNCYHTVGSCFAVKAKSYCAQGGMNKRKAGEDFYFLQKLFDLGTFSECTSTRIIPSPRPSDRVPFGTGPVVNEYLENRREINTFHPHLFEILRSFFDKLPLLYAKGEEDPYAVLLNEDGILTDYLRKIDFRSMLTEIRENSSGYESFRKRFFRRFNMFRMLKFLNSAAGVYPPQPVVKAASQLMEKLLPPPAEEALNLLWQYRRLEKDN